MTAEKRDYNRFAWEDLGDIGLGRPNLGQSVPVAVYRLLLFTMRDALVQSLGAEKAREIFRAAGRLAGEEFYRHVLPQGLDFNAFVAALQRHLREERIGILRLERADLETLEMTLTVAEDLDCSGLPVSDETVCDFDEGFLGGVLRAHTGREFTVREVDCWASGDRVCRFEIKPGS